MAELHPIHKLLDKSGQASEEEALLAAAIVMLSTQPRYSSMTLEDVYDEVAKHRRVLAPSTPPTMGFAES
jgi:hypothetical protein